MKPLFILFFAFSALANEPLARKGALIFSDDFERSELGDWKTVIPSFAVQNGVLKGWQTRDDHGAVGRIYKPMKDVVVEFRFMLAGSTGFNAVFDDKNHKGSHAGHICQATVSPTGVNLSDAKTGGFTLANDLYARKKANALTEADKKLLADKSKRVPVKLSLQEWHTLVVQTEGEELRVLIDGRKVGEFRSEGIGHATKSLVSLTTNPVDVHYDDFALKAAAR